MRDAIERVLTRPGVTEAVATGLAYVAFAFAGRWIGRVSGVTVPLTPGLVLGLALLLGSVVAWGAGAGAVIVDLTSGTFGPTTAVAFVSQFVLVVIVVRLWGAFGRLSSEEPPGTASARNVLEFVVLSVTAALVVGPLRAWGGTLFGTAPFASAVLEGALGVALSALTVGFAVCYLGNRYFRTPTGSPRDRRESETRSTAGTRVFGVALAWTIGGLALGIAFQTVQLHRNHVLVNRFGRTAAGLVQFAGPGGATVQLLLGAASLAACLVLLDRARPTDGGRR